MSSHIIIPSYVPTLRQLIRCTQAFERFSGAHVKKWV